MADDGIYTTNAQIAVKAGANVNTTAITVAETDKYVLDVESMVNCMTRFNWSDKFTSGLNADVVGLLREASANLCAIYAIQYDMSGFTSRAEAEDMISTLRDAAMRAISLLRDWKVQEFMVGA